MPIIILLFVFISIAAIALVVVPLILTSAQEFQERKIAQTTRKLDDMYMDVKKNKLMVVQFIAPVVVGMGAAIILQNLAIGIAVIILGYLVPSIAVIQLQKARREKFRGQLADVLTILSSSLKAGLSLSQAIEAVVDEMPAPTSQEFGVVVKEAKIGVPLEQSFERLNKKLNLEEFNLIAVAILIARETGGNLTRIFENLAYTMREKKKVTEQIKTLTVQGRWQGMIMSGLPIFFAIFVYKTNPQYLDLMLKSDIGRGLLIYAAISQIIGIFIIQRISKMEV